WSERRGRSRVQDRGLLLRLHDRVAVGWHPPGGAVAVDVTHAAVGGRRGGGAGRGQPGRGGRGAAREGRVVLSQAVTVGGRPGTGVAQGGVIQTADGQWYAMLFQDEGPLGRSPQLVGVTWDDD